MSCEDWKRWISKISKCDNKQIQMAPPRRRFRQGSELEKFRDALASWQREVPVGSQCAHEAGVAAALREEDHRPEAGEHLAVVENEHRRGGPIQALQRRVDQHLQPNGRKLLALRQETLLLEHFVTPPNREWGREISASTVPCRHVHYY